MEIMTTEETNAEDEFADLTLPPLPPKRINSLFISDKAQLVKRSMSTLRKPVDFKLVVDDSDDDGHDGEVETDIGNVTEILKETSLMLNEGLSLDMIIQAETPHKQTDVSEYNGQKNWLSAVSQNCNDNDNDCQKYEVKGQNYDFQLIRDRTVSKRYPLAPKNSTLQYLIQDDELLGPEFLQVVEQMTRHQIQTVDVSTMDSVATNNWRLVYAERQDIVLQLQGLTTSYHKECKYRDASLRLLHLYASQQPISMQQSSSHQPDSNSQYQTPRYISRPLANQQSNQQTAMMHSITPNTMSTRDDRQSERSAGSKPSRIRKRTNQSTVSSMQSGNVPTRHQHQSHNKRDSATKIEEAVRATTEAYFESTGKLHQLAQQLIAMHNQLQQLDAQLWHPVVGTWMQAVKTLKSRNELMDIECQRLKSLLQSNETVADGGKDRAKSTVVQDGRIRALCEIVLNQRQLPTKQ